MSPDATRHKVFRYAFVAIAASMVITALSLQALGAYHVYQSLAQDETAPAAPQLCAPQPVMSLPVGEPAIDIAPFGSDAPLTPPTTSTPAPAMEVAPLCEFGEVILIAAHGDPLWSFASLRDGQGPARHYRAGDSFNQHTIDAIDWDHLSLRSGEQRCQLRLGVRGRPAPPNKPTTTTGTSANDELHSALDDLIQQGAPGEIIIDRRAVELLMENLPKFWRGGVARPVADGLKLVRLPKGKVFHKIGLRRGDVLMKINGYDVNNPQHMLEAYGKLPRADNVTLTFKRGGKMMAIDAAVR